MNDEQLRETLVVHFTFGDEHGERVNPLRVCSCLGVLGPYAQYAVATDLAVVCR